VNAQTRVAIVDCGSSKVPDIARVLKRCGVAPSVIRPADLPSIASDLPSALILSGNPALIEDTGTDFLTNYGILRELRIPILGICFGHQVIGLLYGGEVSRGQEDRGLRQIDVLRENPLFAGIAATGEFRQDHTEEVSVPTQFAHLASSSHCRNEAMAHPDLPIVGVQFHPETSGDAGERLIRNFLSLV